MMPGVGPTGPKPPALPADVPPPVVEPNVNGDPACPRAPGPPPAATDPGATVPRPVGVVPTPPPRGGCWPAPARPAAPPGANGFVDGAPATACPTAIGWKSSSVIGSLYFLRRNRCSTRISREGGKVPAYLR